MLSRTVAGPVPRIPRTTWLLVGLSLLSSCSDDGGGERSVDAQGGRETTDAGASNRGGGLTGGVASGGGSLGGAATGGGGEGGAARGGAPLGGADNSAGRASGGSTSGVGGYGGAATGGSGLGGVATGGATMAGATSAGSGVGGTASGGAATGGFTSGGSGVGGAEQGGDEQAGSPQGGAAQGGEEQGGAAEGGTDGLGGATTGGVNGTGGSTPGELVAFPGAEGFGRHATGARGGDVYHVTNLNDSGEGSLRDAISVANRTIVFDVSGVINVGERLVFQANLTIAGQTAPGGGVVVYGNGTSFTNSNNTIVRYMRFRMGVGGDSGKDTITIARGHDMIFDHCSISWARDGNFDLNQESGYELANITLQDSIVSQGLQTHSTGGLMVANGVTVLRSLYIDNNSRNPKARQTTQWVNNVDYNWVASGYILGDTSGRSDGYLAGNYFIFGPKTDGGTLNSPTAAYHVYAAGNYVDNNKNGTLDGHLLEQGDFGSVTWEATPSVDFPTVTELTAAEAYDTVVANAGASLWRDEVDDYVIAELTSLGTRGATISDESSLGVSGNVGQIPTGTAPTDTDRDGMPDAWESSNGLNPNDGEDRNGDRNGDGWTNLEEYINSLVP